MVTTIIPDAHTRLRFLSLSQSVADRSAVTTLDIELACDTLNSIGFDDLSKLTDVPCGRHSGISVWFRGFAQLTVAYAAYCLQG